VAAAPRISGRIRSGVRTHSKPSLGARSAHFSLSHVASFTEINMQIHNITSSPHEKKEGTVTQTWTLDQVWRPSIFVPISFVKSLENYRSDSKKKEATGEIKRPYV
jgi:hypothetical protein